MDEQPRFAPDVEAQLRWAKELLHAGCDLLDKIKQGYIPSKEERLLRVNGLRFAYGRARELGFVDELNVLMLSRGIHILEEKLW